MTPEKYKLTKIRRDRIPGGEERRGKNYIYIRLMNMMGHTWFWVYFGLVEETASQNFKERKTYVYKIMVNKMKGWNMTVKTKIFKKF